MAWSTEQASAPAGFEGSFAGVGLSDVIQLNAHNRYTGCVAVESGGARGRVFMREGQIVHAEAGDLGGEAAFVEIMSWRGGSFALQSTVTTTRVTVQKPTAHLLLDAVRLLDERASGRAATPPPGATPAPAATPPPSVAALFERLRAVRGIAYAVVTGPQGACIDDDTHEGQALGGQGLFVAQLAERLGGPLGLGSLSAAVGRGEQGGLVVMTGGKQLLTVQVAREVPAGAVEEGVRRALKGGRP